MQEEGRSRFFIPGQTAHFVPVAAQPATRKFVPVAQVVIQARGELIVFIGARVRAVEVIEESLRITRLVGLGNKSEDLFGNRINAVGRNQVVGKSRARAVVARAGRGQRIVDGDRLAVGLQRL